MEKSREAFVKVIRSCKPAGVKGLARRLPHFIIVRLLRMEWSGIIPAPVDSIPCSHNIGYLEETPSVFQGNEKEKGGGVVSNNPSVKDGYFSFENRSSLDILGKERLCSSIVLCELQDCCWCPITFIVDHAWIADMVDQDRTWLLPCHRSVSDALRVALQYWAWPYG